MITSVWSRTRPHEEQAQKLYPLADLSVLILAMPIWITSCLPTILALAITRALSVSANMITTTPLTLRTLFMDPSADQSCLFFNVSLQGG